GPAAQPRIAFDSTAFLAPLTNNAVRCNQLERSPLRDREDLLDLQPLFGAKAAAASLGPDDPSHDQMIAALELDHGAFGHPARGLDQQPARGNVENAGVAPF